jgi:hypothetical protein
MGMYDTLKVKKDLPLPEEVKHLNINWQEIEYQTKSFENCLSEYVIGEDDKLYEFVVDREYIPYTKEERKNKDIKPWNLWKEVNIKKEELVPQENYHGVVRFYCYEDYDEDYSFFIDYNAYFTYGKLDKIEFVEFNKHKKNNEQIKEMLKERESVKYRVVYCLKKYTGWSFLCRKLEISLYAVANLLHKLRMILIRIG